MRSQTDPDHSLTRGTVFRAVARLRFTEAQLLYRQQHSLGAVYLAGYAIECHLKYAVCVANEFLHLPLSLTLPDGKSTLWLYTHDWDVLVAQLNCIVSLQSSA